MKNQAAFIMPVHIKGNEIELRLLREAVDSIKSQTDEDWVLIMVDDRSDDETVYRALEELKRELGEKVHLIYQEQHTGAGETRNVGIRYAAELGAPFILFNDSDDISDPRRLELVRNAFEADESVNVVYLSFDVIDEHGNMTPYEEINLSVREIIDGHQLDIVEGEDAWMQIVARKGYTNLTSCTAVRTWLAVEEPFPGRSVSEDAHTWLRYGAHPGKFVFLRDIINHYRICTGVASRSRGINTDFYEQKAAVDRDGFEAAMELSKRFGRVGERENDLRIAFYVREALSLLYGGAENCAAPLLMSAVELSADKTFAAISALRCEETYKDKMLELIRGD